MAWLGAVACVLVVGESAGLAAAKCEICGGPFGASVLAANDPVRRVKREICLECSTSKKLCSACTLPVNVKTATQLDDGRVICDLDAKGVILTEHELVTIFRETQREVGALLAYWPPLPDRNIAVRMVNRDQLVAEYRKLPGIDDPENLLGLTVTRQSPQTNFEHTIYLLSGLLRPQLMNVCAHEYAHAWLNEHLPKTRSIHKDTAEGFCEWIAWKFSTARQHHSEIERVLASDYTKGQLHALVAAEKQYQFDRLMKWILEGQDSWLDKDKLERLLVLRDEPVLQPILVSRPAPKSPEALELRGISGSGGRRFAIINNVTFSKNERARVPLGATNVVVKCTDIREASVLVQVDDSRETMELFMRRTR